jgi:hypothetical protein
MRADFETLKTQVLAVNFASLIIIYNTYTLRTSHACVSCNAVYIGNWMDVFNYIFCKAYTKENQHLLGYSAPTWESYSGLPRTDKNTRENIHKIQYSRRYFDSL